MGGLGLWFNLLLCCSAAGCIGLIYFLEILYGLCAAEPPPRSGENSSIEDVHREEIKNIRDFPLENGKMHLNNKQKKKTIFNSLKYSISLWRINEARNTFVYLLIWISTRMWRWVRLSHAGGAGGSKHFNQMKTMPEIPHTAYVRRRCSVAYAVHSATDTQDSPLYSRIT